MALADYDTSAEKIAALKAAALDPSLARIVNANFTTDDVIYLTALSSLTADGIDLDGFNSYASMDADDYIINTGVNIIHCYPSVYIKDSDITYPDPITTYQNRLALAYTTLSSTIGQSGSFTSGANGSIITAGNHTLINSEEYDWGNVWFNRFAIPPGTVITTTSHTVAFCTYFDVPADW